jgi:hypothetical protein
MMANPHPWGFMLLDEPTLARDLFAANGVRKIEKKYYLAVILNLIPDFSAQIAQPTHKNLWFFFADPCPFICPNDGWREIPQNMA